METDCYVWDSRKGSLNGLHVITYKVFGMIQCRVRLSATIMIIILNYSKVGGSLELRSLNEGCFWVFGKVFYL